MTVGLFAAAIAGLAAVLVACAPPGATPARQAVAGSGPATASTTAARLVYHGELTQGGWLKGQAPAGTRSLAVDGTPVALAEDGSFLVGFDRDAGTSARLTAVLANGRTMTETLTIAPRAWQIEHVATPLRPRGSDEAFRRRRADELARIAGARAVDTGSAGWRQRFVWPARGRISGRFGAQRIYAGTPGSYHSGLDIAGGSGSVFMAPADGVVVLAAAEPFTLEGRLLILDHGAGLNSAFLHCSELLVREGERVRQGQPIGRIGMSGRATGPHLHWSLKWREARLDPILFIGPMPPG